MKVKLGEICQLNMGQSPDSSSYNENGNGIPFFQGNADFGEFHPNVRVYCNAPTKIAHAGDILISVRAPIGALNIADRDCCIGRGLAALTVNESVCSRQYLWHGLASKVEELKSKGTGSTFKAISKNVLAETKLPLPEIVEQQRIAIILDEADGLMKRRKQQLQKLDELVKARFVEMFGDPEINPMGWRIEKLGDLLSVEPQNGLYKPQSDYVQDGTGTPILRIDAFYEGKVTGFSGLKRLVCTDTERMRYLLHENDIVINRVNSIEYLGKCAWITGMMEPTVFESNMMRFHVDESQIDPCYLTRLLCSTYIYNQILNRAKKAVNQASINQGDVQSFLIVVPPIGLQKSFAAFVSQVDKSKSSIQASLDQLETLKQSLMQKYFG